MQGLESAETMGSSKEARSSKRVFSRDINYLRDLALFWPFVISSVFALPSLLSPSHRQMGLMFAVCAISAVVLAKEKLLMIFAALGFVAIQSAIYLALHPWRWGVFVVGVLTGIPALLANRYWRKPKLGYQWPSEMGAVDALLSLASIFGFIFLFFVVARILFGRVR